jgi:Transcriptional Coactivator p15 (PC4)
LFSVHGPYVECSSTLGKQGGSTMNTITIDDARNTKLPPTQAASALLVIGEESLNSRDTLRVAFDEFEGRRVIDIRKFYRRQDDELRPTKKGLTLAVERLPALAELIAAALDRARADGLLPAAVAR